MYCGRPYHTVANTGIIDVSRYVAMFVLTIIRLETCHYAFHEVHLTNFCFCELLLCCASPYCTVTNIGIINVNSCVAVFEVLTIICLETCHYAFHEVHLTNFCFCERLLCCRSPYCTAANSGIINVN